ncbi:hypothetical protein C2845_PM03G28320 [Panicum miliaceum]|uniref:RecA family profile 1 domain-containing protein n=1 Tax=Panicum miliaceum TaxID=4540 RepID=A0A3L6TD50_PANMI|nr:hypothetical protein C2845_PM03G28320 [Panicum miliaceum]
MSATRGRSGGGATASGCGLKRRNAPQDHEDSEMMNQDQPSTEDWCGRFWNGMELFKDVTEKKHFLPTGLKSIDTLLGGGLRQGQLTEITGPSSSGKTQPKDARLKSVMRSIICESVFDIFALFEVNNGGSKVCLLIIDSISSLLAPIIGGKYPQGRSMMISVAVILKKLADEHNLSVLVTNHMVSAGNGAVKPALGESWKAVPHVRLMISRECENNICTATVLKHTLLVARDELEEVEPREEGLHAMPHLHTSCWNYELMLLATGPAPSKAAAAPRSHALQTLLAARPPPHPPPPAPGQAAPLHYLRLPQAKPPQVLLGCTPGRERPTLLLVRSVPSGF